MWRIPTIVDLPGGNVSSLLSSPAPQLTVDDVSSAEHALATFTTGSTGYPKLLLRQHAFLTKQSTALSLAYQKMSPDETLDESKSAGLTNLPIMTLHFLKVSVGCFQADTSMYDC